MANNILIIDDDKNILYAMGEICKLEKWKPFKASNVTEALDILEARKIDLIIIDYHMPNINGVEGVKMIRERDTIVPIIVLTVEENEKVSKEFMDAGASDFALKPVKALDILSRIKLNLKIRELKSDKQDSIYEYSKGRSPETLEVIINSMRDSGDEYLSLKEISEISGFAYQTIHRYMQNLESDNLVDVYNKYGDKGRPQKLYRIKEYIY